MTKKSPKELESQFLCLQEEVNALGARAAVEV